MGITQPRRKTRASRADRVAERLLHTAIQEAMHGRSIRVLDIPKAYALARGYLAEGETLDHATRMAIDQYAV